MDALSDFKEGKEVTIKLKDFEAFVNEVKKEPELYEYTMDYSVPEIVKIRPVKR